MPSARSFILRENPGPLVVSLSGDHMTWQWDSTEARGHARQDAHEPDVCSSYPNSQQSFKQLQNVKTDLGSVAKSDHKSCVASPH